jgi:hypothetical protein
LNELILDITILCTRYKNFQSVYPGFFFQNEAVYLFTEGNSIESCKGLLKEKVNLCLFDLCSSFVCSISEAICDFYITVLSKTIISICYMLWLYVCKPIYKLHNVSWVCSTV